MAERPQLDTVVVGGGPSGLTCAFYLARAGLKVRIRPLGYFVPLWDDDSFLMGRSPEEKLADIARLSAKDAAAWPECNRRLDALVEVLQQTLDKTPPNAGGGLGQLTGALGLGNAVRRAGLEGQRDLLDLFGKSAGEILVSWFETDVLKGILAFDALTGNYASPYALATVTRYAPIFRDAIVGRMVLTPLDLENKLGLTDGDIFHGALRLDQLFSARPMLGYVDYRMPLDGLYLCGSGAHPGGGVTGIPGHNAAREMLREMRRGKLPTQRRAAA